MSTASSPITAAPAASTAKTGEMVKVWQWIEKEVTHVEVGIEDNFGSQAAQAIETAGKELLSSDMGPVIVTALADATNVVTGQMSVSAAITNLVTAFKAAGKKLTESAALQVIGVAQNALPAKPQTVTPVA